MENIYGEPVSEIIQKAKKLAQEKHAHLHMMNKDKSPIIEHISEVAYLVEDHGGNEDMITAAWLHDIVEDTDVTIDDLKKDFGDNIARLVIGLTDPDDFATLPLHIRKEKQAVRLKGKSNDIKLIKICDQLSNTVRVTNDPPTNWDDHKQWQYVCGAKKIVDVCKGISPELDKKFNDAYEHAKQKYGVKS